MCLLEIMAGPWDPKLVCGKRIAPSGHVSVVHFQPALLNIRRNIEATPGHNCRFLDKGLKLIVIFYVWR